MKSLARAHTESCIRRIKGLAAQAESETVRLEANRVLLDRGWGKPANTTEHTGKDGGPITVRVVYGEEDD